MSDQIISHLNMTKNSFHHTFSWRKSDFSRICTMFAGLIAAMIYIFALTGGDFRHLLVVQGAFVLWLTVLIIVRQNITVFPIRSIFILLILAVILSSNLLVNYENYDVIGLNLKFSVAHGVGILVFVFAAQWAAANLYPDYILERISLMLLPLMLMALAVGWFDSESIRAAPFGVHPNWWGEVAFGFILCSLSLTRVMVKILFIMIGILLMITVQSRGALLAATISLMSYLFIQHRPFGIVNIKKAGIVGSIIIGLVVLVTATDLGLVILKIIESKILLLDNPYRGLGSGLTGRFAGWREAAELFVQNPVFGHGFDTLVEVHNGFLRWAGEGGVMLLGFMLLLMMSAIVRSWRSHNEWSFAALLGIMAYMMTYPRALNLNLVGMLFFFTLFPWKYVRIESSSISLHGHPKSQPTSSSIH